GVPADAVQAAGRLVEGVTGLEDLGLVVVDGPLVLALQDVPERRAGVAVRRLHLARRQRHLDHRGFRLLPVQLLDDVLLGEHLDVSPAFAVLAVLCQTHPAGRESAHDDRQQGTSHDCSSERTGASDPSGNKDVEGGTVCDRLEEHSRKGGALRGGEGERRLVGRSDTNRRVQTKLRNCSGPPHLHRNRTSANLLRLCGQVSYGTSPRAVGGTAGVETSSAPHKRLIWSNPLGDRPALSEGRPCSIACSSAPPRWPPSPPRPASRSAPASPAPPAARGR